MIMGFEVFFVCNCGIEDEFEELVWQQTRKRKTKTMKVRMRNMASLENLLGMSRQLEALKNYLQY